MINEKRKRLRNKYILFLLICFTFFALYISQNTLSKYIVVINEDKNTISVAKPIIILKTHEPVNKVSPINNMEVDFDILNYNNEEDIINDVKLKYTITLGIENAMPFNFELKDSNDNLLSLDSNLTTITSFYMPASTKVTHSYKLIISWDGDTSYSYQDISNDLNIQINIEQTQI